MNFSIDEQRQGLLNNLYQAVRASKKKRLCRIATNPWRTWYAKLLNITNKSKEIKAQTFFGKTMFVLLPEVVSVHIWRYGFLEGDGVCLPMLYCLKEGMTFVDIGAHIGFFTLLGSSLVGKTGKVLSFEPTPSTFKLLKKNISDCSNVHAYNCAAFSEEKKLEFYDYGVNLSAFNSAHGIRKRRNSLISGNKIVVEAVKVDSVIEKTDCGKVDFIKIDVESSEIYVLEGLSKTIETHKPYILMEVGDFGVDGVPNSRELVIWLQKRGYTPYEVGNGKIVEHKKQDSYDKCMNLFFAPELYRNSR